jgi:hypothetical protein
LKASYSTLLPTDTDLTATHIASSTSGFGTIRTSAVPTLRCSTSLTTSQLKLRTGPTSKDRRNRRSVSRALSFSWTSSRPPQQQQPTCPRR